MARMRRVSSKCPAAAAIAAADTTVPVIIPSPLIIPSGSRSRLTPAARRLSSVVICRQVNPRLRCESRRSPTECLPESGQLLPSSPTVEHASQHVRPVGHDAVDTKAQQSPHRRFLVDRPDVNPKTTVVRLAYESAGDYRDDVLVLLGGLQSLEGRVVKGAKVQHVEDPIDQQLNRGGSCGDLALADSAEARNRAPIVGDNQGAFRRLGGFDLAEHGLLYTGTMTFDFDIEGRVLKRLIQGLQRGDLDTLGSPRERQTAVGAKSVARVKTLQFRDCFLSHGSGAICCAGNDGVMNDND